MTEVSKNFMTEKQMTIDILSQKMFEKIDFNRQRKNSLPKRSEIFNKNKQITMEISIKSLERVV